MNTDGSAFLRRALKFLDACRRDWAPTAAWLAESDGISVPSARRVIQRLMNEYNAPLRYAERRKGWVLESPWLFPVAPSVERGELMALWHAAARASGMDTTLDTLLRGVLLRLEAQLQSDTALLSPTSQGHCERALVLPGTFSLLERAVCEHRWVTFDYTSPWKDTPMRSRRVAPLHLRLHDARAYLLGEEDGTEKLYQVARVTELAVSDARFTPRPSERSWDAAGIWQTGPVLSVVVRLAAPSGRYHAQSIWHPAQADVWSGNELHRTFPARRSPELTSRLLGLGTDLLGVSPAPVAGDLASASATLTERFPKPKTCVG